MGKNTKSKASPLPIDELRARIRLHHRSPESEFRDLFDGILSMPDSSRKNIAETARSLNIELDRKTPDQPSIAAFMRDFGLSSPEGRALMCLSESLLRIPDAETAKALIDDQVFKGRSRHPKNNILLSRILEFGANNQTNSFSDHYSAITNAISALCEQFVFDKSIDRALTRSAKPEYAQYRFTFDMLGESARTMPDAERYFLAYKQAIQATASASGARDLADRPAISVKLSALHPRYELLKKNRIMDELLPKLVELCVLSKNGNLSFVIDGEESERLDLSLDIVERLGAESALSNWNGLGLGVQAYQKRAPFVIDWLASLGQNLSRRWMIRLVKGAYWDYEIKTPQERGLQDYSVFTDKSSTDLSYLVCAKKLLENPDIFYPQFATHNTYTVASVVEFAGGPQNATGKMEFQCLHGMGKALYDIVNPADKLGIPSRMYAPVGNHHDLLPYLARRLIEYGAPSSFVHERPGRTRDSVSTEATITASGIQGPRRIYGDQRLSSMGIDLSDPLQLSLLTEKLAALSKTDFTAAAIVNGIESGGPARPVLNPADATRRVGTVVEASPQDIDHAITSAQNAFPAWSREAVAYRASLLEKAADLIELEMLQALALCVFEAGKTIADSIADWREAIDFCRYYAAIAKEQLAQPQNMPGPTGESNLLSLHGRGVFACISPWNFPLAIFTGQIAAALVTGNTVLAKPAEQTPLSAAFIVRLFHKAGIPTETLHLLPGDGPSVGAPIVADSRIAGVVFTGSVETAKLINRTLAARSGPIIPLIAETGGLNALIADSSALPEQIVRDTLISAFQSAGQRCSSLRLLFLQEEIAASVLTMLAGAMRELKVGNPSYIDTDIGPVIDQDAWHNIQTHVNQIESKGQTVGSAPVSAEYQKGYFIAPRAVLLPAPDLLTREVFGPILHIVQYKKQALDKVLQAVNATGFGLTAGIHSRLDTNAAYISSHISAGNIYINRSTIGAIVGTQPFGGHGLSGTGPKAGGPHYLTRFCTERVVTTDLTAIGGNTRLISETRV